eukprot:SAG22_NODE_523_length_9482_cov_4.992548_2_plen_209_part_00
MPMTCPLSTPSAVCLAQVSPYRGQKSGDAGSGAVVGELASAEQARRQRLLSERSAAAEAGLDDDTARAPDKPTSLFPTPAPSTPQQPLPRPNPSPAPRAMRTPQREPLPPTGPGASPPLPFRDYSRPRVFLPASPAAADSAEPGGSARFWWCHFGTAAGGPEEVRAAAARQLELLAAAVDWDMADGLLAAFVAPRRPGGGGGGGGAAR